MATLKLQGGRMLTVIPSDNAKIPYPNVVTSGTNTSASSLKLINSGATFITSKVSVGDIVYNTTDSSAATVQSVDSETQLTLNANIFSAGSKAYTIYNGTMNETSGGCVFQTGGAGNVVCVNQAGDTATLVGVAGQYHPINVVQIKSTDTTATLITAIW